MSFTLATWNINSVRLREALVSRLLTEEQPDVLCLQEIKTPLEKMPLDGFRALGYTHVVARGQKGYNGVAILSKLPLLDAGFEPLLRLLSLARRQGGDVGDGQFSDIGGAIAAHAQVLKFCTGRAIREVDRHPAGANIGDRILAVAAYAGGGTCRGANDHRVATSVGQDNAVLVTDARGANEGEFR